MASTDIKTGSELVAVTQPYRVVLKRKPPVKFEWKGVFEGWSRNWVHKNFWRVRELMGSEEDAMQECAVIFAYCCKLYEGKVDNAAWMMAIFKRAVINDWNTFAKRDSKRRAIPLPEPDESIDLPLGLLASAMQECSAELQEVLRVIAGAPAELLQILFFRSEDLTGGNEARAQAAEGAIDRRICRLLRLGRPIAVLAELRALLSP